VRKRMVPEEVLAAARRVLEVEEKALADLRGRMGPEFVRALELLLLCKGKVVLTGMGKSGLVCRKIAATLASTGTPAFFLHPGEGGHGDLGMLSRGDALIAVSYSGEAAEVMLVLPSVKRLGIPVIAFSGNPRSSLARAADVCLSIEVAEEACPLGLAPTPAPPPPWRWATPWRWRFSICGDSPPRTSPSSTPEGCWDGGSCSRWKT
jgi:arabinose-5-phosphate isomerase